VAQTVRLAYDGEVVTSVRYGDEDVDFRVQLARAARQDLAYLETLEVPNRENRLIPLGHVAALTVGPGPANFYHYNGERTVTVTADVDQERTTPVEATRRVLAQFDVTSDYPGARLLAGGEADETQESVNDLMATFVLAVVGIYFLLVLLFNSFLQPLVVLFAIPFGAVGVVLAFAAHGEPFGFLAMLGVIGLSGVVVNDSLVLVAHLNRLARSEPDADLRRLVARGTADRVRAITMTSVTTIAGLLPLAYGLGGSDPYMSPMALALGWGILLATPLTLVLVPSLYLAGSDAVDHGARVSRRVLAHVPFSPANVKTGNNV
jgi:multidrug efflux pump subunit AcrB